MRSKLKSTTAVFGAAVLTVSLAGAGAAVAAPPVQDLNDVKVIARADAEFPNYRIPAITQLTNGDVLISYDGRPTGIDSPGPNSILQRRSTDLGASWAQQTVVEAGHGDPQKEGYSDPSYVYDEEQNLLFNFHVYSKDTGLWGSVAGNDDADRRVMSSTVSKSADNGNTWEHKRITTS